MAIYAQIIYEDAHYTFEDIYNGSFIVEANVFIGLFDSTTGLPVAGNGATVVYYDGDINAAGTGVPAYITLSLTFPGATNKLSIYGGPIQEMYYDSSGTLLNGYTKYFAIESVIPGTGGGGCDIAFIGDPTKTDESASGANDGTITASAASTAGGIVYSLDLANFQDSGNFTGLAPGSYTVYAQDNAGCRISFVLYVNAYNKPIVGNLTNAYPIVEVPAGNISRWNAAFNPIRFNFQRRDYLITGITQDGEGYKVKLDRLLTTQEINNAKNDRIYLRSNYYEYTGPIASATTDAGVTVLHIDDAFINDDPSGFVNNINTKPNYKIDVELTYGSNHFRKEKIIAAFYPGVNGYSMADMSGFLKTLLSPNDLFKYDVVNWRDDKLGASYTVRFREVWDGSAGTWFDAPYPFYVTYAAMQLGERYGGNMAQYVPFVNTLSTVDKAKFLTDFAEPVYNQGMPFDIAFILSENIINEVLYLELTPNAGDVVASLLLNADASHLLTADASRFVIEKTVTTAASVSTGIIKALGVNRILINPVFTNLATKFNVNIYYKNEADEKVYVMQDLTVRIKRPCADPYVYLKWINHLGGWDYYRFGYNQRLSGEVKNDSVIERRVLNWESDETILDITRKSGRQKITCGADSLDEQTLNGLKWLRNSIKVQMLVSLNPIKWQTVIVGDGDIDAYGTRRKSGSIQLTLSLPNTNIQQQ